MRASLIVFAGIAGIALVACSTVWGFEHGTLEVDAGPCFPACEEEAGLACGRAGPTTCGSNNCYEETSDAHGSCEGLGPYTRLYGCGGLGVTDVMPNCERGATLRPGEVSEVRFYCCANN